jgi:arylsulfatase A-like enzyme/Tfp pilus assembly protein PilF
VVSRIAGAVAAAALIWVAGRGLAAPRPGPQDRAASLLLVTLDTTRADHLGAYGARWGSTPVLDALAARGARWARALSACPLTLPAHATLLTGREPPEHGLRDNGLAALPAELPTLATVLGDRGWDTAAIVASRVLDRRFGLARGFATYDDRMVAEAVGQYGYAERDARAVTDAALAWLARRSAAAGGAERPWFLWVHYYDPHAPYAPPGATSASEAERYAGEIAYVDRELGRLLDALPAGGRDTLVAVVGDHGESLGEHGETGHGILLYEPSLRVPLLVAGPGVPSGTVVAETVATSRLAATLLALLGLSEQAAAFGAPLPGVGVPGSADDPPAVYSETLLPATAYGWSALQAVSDERWRLIVAPRPELYDLLADAAEVHDRFGEERAQASRLRGELAALEATMEPRQSAGPNAAELAADLRTLGYLSGASGETARARFGEGLDPKDGIALLADFDRAKTLRAAGRAAEARALLETLLERNPGNVPFRAQLAAALLATGEAEAGIAQLERALASSPRLDFLHVELARARLGLGDLEGARRAAEAALALDPRQADAWLALGEVAARSATPAEERRLLEQAVAAGTESAIVLTRLGQLALARGDLDGADAHLAEALRLLPEWGPAWLLWGDAAERRDLPGAALVRYLRAAELEPRDAVAALRASRLLLAAGDTARARSLLEQAAAAAPESPAGQEALRRLDALDGPP